MTENLNKKPPKGILKSSSSFDTASVGSGVGVGGRRNSGVSVGGGSIGGESVGGCTRQGSNELTVEYVGGGSIDGECCGGGSGGEDGEGYVHVRKHSKTAKFDEMNILETYHPATKTYGHMKIEEPKTPFNYYEDEEDDGGQETSQCSTSSKRRSKEINADELVRKLNECKDGGGEVDEEEESSEEDGDEDDESKETRLKFESKRKAHYNEYYAVKLARKLMEQEEDDDGEDDGKRVRGGEGVEKFIPEEEVGVGDNGDRMVTDQDIEDGGGGGK